MTTPLPRAVLSPGRDAPFRGGHPWVFSGALQRVEGEPADGDEIRVVTTDGAFVARGLYNGRSQIRVRLYRWEDAALDAGFFTGLLDAAVDLRHGLLGLGAPGGACRLVFSEADGLSGLTVDRYAGYLTVQFTSLALARRRDVILDHLAARLAPDAVVIRTEKGILEEEGLELSDHVARGEVADDAVIVEEGGLRWGVDVRTGQKTGFYLDQRHNRERAAGYATGRSVADVCCYSGGFGITAAARGAASVVGVDVSAPSLALAEANAVRNQVADAVRFERGDAFRWLEARGEAGARYGMVVLDPPRFARTRRGVPQALKGYERLNALALRVLEPDGILVTCSCSGRVSAEEFLAAVGRAAAASGRSVQVLERLGQAADHPVLATCPETAYLKCFICRVA